MRIASLLCRARSGAKASDVQAAADDAGKTALLPSAFFAAEFVPALVEKIVCFTPRSVGGTMFRPPHSRGFEQLHASSSAGQLARAIIGQERRPAVRP